MDKTSEIKLYGEIGWKNNGESFSDILDKLEKEGCKDLTIRLHSYGGSVFEGVVMFNALQRSSMNIKIVIDGIAASMASMLLVAVGEVEISENGFIMIHTPSSSANGNAETMKQVTKLLTDIENNFVKQYSAKTNLSENEIKQKWFDGKDHWLNADEAVQLGLANRKIPAIVRNIKSLDKEVISGMSVKNVYDKYAAIFNNKNETEMKKELIETFELTGLTEQSSDTAVLNQLKAKFDELESKVQKNSQEEDKIIKSMIEGAIKDGKITVAQKQSLETIGKTSGVDVLSNVLSMLGKRQPTVIASLIKDGRTSNQAEKNVKDKKDWTLQDYRMFAPKELANNHNLYDELVKKEYGQD